MNSLDFSTQTKILLIAQFNLTSLLLNRALKLLVQSLQNLNLFLYFLKFTLQLVNQLIFLGKFFLVQVLLLDLILGVLPKSLGCRDQSLNLYLLKGNLFLLGIV